MTRFFKVCTIATMVAMPSLSQAIGIGAMPSRYVLSASSGDQLIQKLNIVNESENKTSVQFKTLDWSLNNKGEVEKSESLYPDSCRPWVTLQYEKTNVPAKGKKKTRFQVDIPKDAPQGECRFMIVVETTQPEKHAIKKGGASFSMPVIGVLNIPVYIAINGAKPELTVLSSGVKKSQGHDVAYIRVKNEGNAHGRFGLGVPARDAHQKSFELWPHGTPILPGQTADVEFFALGVKRTPLPPEIAFPYHVNAVLPYSGGEFTLNTTFILGAP